MHRSRLAAIGIDCPTATALASARFWRGALTPDGGPVDGFDDADPYVEVGSCRGAEVFVQRIGPDDLPRVHLDIETDDVAAEVARLEALGAERVEQVSTWWVLQDPAGQRFCVVRPQVADFPGDAATWP